MTKSDIFLPYVWAGISHLWAAGRALLHEHVEESKNHGRGKSVTAMHGEMHSEALV